MTTTSVSGISAAPGVSQDVIEGLVEGELGGPAGGRPEAAVVAAKDRVVRWALEVRVGSQLERHAGEFDEPFGQLADRAIDAGTDVVDLARHAVFGDEPIGPDNVTDVGEVPAGLQVADHDVVGAIGLGVCDPRRQTGSDEVRSLPGADVVEGPKTDHVLPGAEVRGRGHGIGRHLRGGVRIGGVKRLVFPDGEIGIGHLSVHLGTGDGENALHSGRPSGVEDVLCALDVGPQGADRVGPGGGDVSLAGKVVDDLGGDMVQVLEHGGAVGDVRTAERAIAHDHIVAGRPQMLLENPAHESGAAGDQCSHQRRLARRRETGRGCWSTELTNR